MEIFHSAMGKLAEGGAEWDKHRGVEEVALVIRELLMNQGWRDGNLEKAKGQGLSKNSSYNRQDQELYFNLDQVRIVLLIWGNSLIINTQHADFIKRNLSKSGKIKLDNRLISYVSVVVGPPCIHKLFEKRGKVPTALEIGSNIVDLGLKLGQELASTVLNEEIEKTVE